MLRLGRTSAQGRPEPLVVRLNATRGHLLASSLGHSSVGLTQEPSIQFASAKVLLVSYPSSQPAQLSFA